MNEILLGCPHCSKPVGYAPAMAGKIVACPHCRGSFQMPAQPPPPAAAPPKRPTVAPPPPQKPLGDGSLDFAGEPLPSGGGSPAVQRIVKAELGSYRAAETMATVFALAGSLGVLVVAALIGFIVRPMFASEEVSIPVKVMWIVSIFVFAFTGIVGMFLIRAVVLVVVDAARCTRAIERDVLANPVRGK